MVDANVVFSAAGGTSAPQHSLAGFQGPLQSRGKRRKGGKRKEEIGVEETGKNSSPK